MLKKPSVGDSRRVWKVLSNKFWKIQSSFKWNSEVEADSKKNEVSFLKLRIRVVNFDDYKANFGTGK